MYMYTGICISVCVHMNMPRCRGPGSGRATMSQKTSTINLFGFETLKLKIRRLKLWKPTVY